MLSADGLLGLVGVCQGISQGVSQQTVVHLYVFRTCSCWLLYLLVTALLWTVAVVWAPCCFTW
jgi:hypothetical protein